MKAQIAVSSLALSLSACGFSDWNSFMGNPKHVCEYNAYASSTVQNRSSKSVPVYFCSPHEKTLKMGGMVLNDGMVNDFNVLTDHKYDEYHDSAPETCANKGIPSGTRYIKGYYASLNAADLATSQLCLNHHDDKYDETAQRYDTELYLVVDHGATCPNGYLPYDQSTNPCSPPTR